MKFTYTISGMTCGGCAAKVNNAFLKHPDVRSVEVSHQDGRARIEAEKLPDRESLQRMLDSAGAYRITGIAEDD